MPETKEDDGIAVPASWYDGISAIRHEGSAHWQRGDLLLEAVDGTITSVASDDLTFAETQADRTVWRRRSAPDFRLYLPRELPPAFAAHLPARQEYGGWIDRFGLGKAAVAFAAVSAAAVALFLTAPDWLGPRIPESWERNLGQAMVGDFGGRLCSTPKGDAALAKLLDRVDPGDPQVTAGIANIDMVNAVALPGAQVLLFDGLVQQAESPEELAGVLGHEVGHVRERHVMTALLRQFGFSILLSGANSGLGDTAFGLAQMGYSRDAEREADDYARARMAESDISPLGAAGFFERMAEEYGDSEDTLFGWVASHPWAGERARLYRQAAREDAPYHPVLTDAEFEALKTMCADDPDVEEFEFF